ncbi:MAG: phosphate signaling complex protein PhoU [Armatimonadetes bacterium]|nr:phosphate signaling complex protein PhoU [Armatimonadota bacterium]
MPGLRVRFEQELQSLQHDLLRMGSYVTDMVNRALQALVRQDVALANEVVRMDDQADAMDLQIEQKCLRLLALQQPMSRDLRLISTALKIITDLERIGDYAVDIAKTARRLAGEVYLKPLVDIPRMGEVCIWMIREALNAYVRRDLDLVNQVVARDDEVDELYDRLFTDLLAYMERDPSLIRQGTWLLHVARFLERIADHIVNVAERVYFMETGDFKQLATSHKPDSA